MVGCAICESPYDECYPAFGGSCGCGGHVQGRVGSIFGSPVGALSPPTASPAIDVVGSSPALDDDDGYDEAEELPTDLFPEEE